MAKSDAFVITKVLKVPRGMPLYKWRGTLKYIYNSLFKNKLKLKIRTLCLKLSKVRLKLVSEPR